MYFDERPAIRPVQRPAIVLLHASASSARQWQGLVDLLQPRYRALAVELHGHGNRPDWTGDAPLSLADDAALVAPLLEQTGGAYLVGHSYGAAVALKLATSHPQWVHGLVAYEAVMFRMLIDDDAFGRPARDVVAVAECIRDGLRSNDAASAARGFIDYWSGDGAWGSMSASRQDAIVARMPSVLRHFDALFPEPVARVQMAQLDIPMLFLTGARTVASTHRIGQLFGAALPAAQHETLPGMAHMGPITHAADFNRRIAGFLRDNAASPPASGPPGHHNHYAMNQESP